jgi:hypothetical protein
MTESLQKTAMLKKDNAARAYCCTHTMSWVHMTGVLHTAHMMQPNQNQSHPIPAQSSTTASTQWHKRAGASQYADHYEHKDAAH